MDYLELFLDFYLYSSALLTIRGKLSLGKPWLWVCSWRAGPLLVREDLHPRVLLIAPTSFPEIIFSSLLLISLENVLQVFVLFGKFLILASTLDRASGADKGRHLFEDLDWPDSINAYLLCSLLDRIDWLKCKKTMNFSIYSSSQDPYFWF